MERGEQYKLAVRRFVKVNGRYPANLDELENLNNRRFLRRRYKDPLTGKDEWRLIHTANGVLTDSKNTQQPGQGTQKPANISDGFLAEMPGLGSTPVPGQNSSAASRRRASDGAPQGPDAPGTSSGEAAPQGGMPGQPGQPGVPGQPGIPGLPPGVPGMPGTPSGTQPGIPGPQPGGFPGSPGAPVSSQTGGVSPTSGGGFVGSGGSFVGGGSGVGSTPNNPSGGQPVYAGQNPAYPTTPGSNGTAPGFPNPGAAPGQSNQAIGMINSILTSPRPGGNSGPKRDHGRQRDRRSRQYGGPGSHHGVLATYQLHAVGVHLRWQADGAAGSAHGHGRNAGQPDGQYGRQQSSGHANRQPDRTIRPDGLAGAKRPIQPARLIGSAGSIRANGRHAGAGRRRRCRWRRHRSYQSQSASRPSLEPHAIMCRVVFCISSPT